MQSFTRVLVSIVVGAEAGEGEGAEESGVVFSGLFTFLGADTLTNGDSCGDGGHEEREHCCERGVREWRWAGRVGKPCAKLQSISVI